MFNSSGVQTRRKGYYSWSGAGFSLASFRSVDYKGIPEGLYQRLSTNWDDQRPAFLPVVSSVYSVPILIGVPGSKNESVPDGKRTLFVYFHCVSPPNPRQWPRASAWLTDRLSGKQLPSRMPKRILSRNQEVRKCRESKHAMNVIGVVETAGF